MRRTRLLVAVALAATAHPTSPASAACAVSGTELPARAGAVVTCVGVHPGTRLSVLMPDTGWRDCAAGFLYADRAGNRYAAVPAHCIWEPTCRELVEVHVPVPAPVPQPVPDLLGEVQRLVTKLVCLVEPSGEEQRFTRNQPAVYDADRRKVGSVVYGVDKPEARFGLVRLDPGVAASPAVPYYGGPVGIDSRASIVPEPVHVVSPAHPLVPFAPYFSARLGMTDFRTPTSNTGLYSPGGSFGDFGAVVTTQDGQAIGQVEVGAIGTGAYVGVRPLVVVQRAAASAKLTLTLLTAKLAR